MNIREIEKCNELIPKLKQLERFASYEAHGCLTTRVYKLNKCIFGVRDGNNFIEIDSKYVFEGINKQIEEVKNELYKLGYED